LNKQQYQHGQVRWYSSSSSAAPEVEEKSEDQGQEYKNIIKNVEKATGMKPA